MLSVSHKSKRWSDWVTAKLPSLELTILNKAFVLLSCATAHVMTIGTFHNLEASPLNESSYIRMRRGTSQIYCPWASFVSKVCKAAAYQPTGDRFECLVETPVRVRAPPIDKNRCLTLEHHCKQSTPYYHFTQKEWRTMSVQILQCIQ